jgi:hypothetical protein
MKGFLKKRIKDEIKRSHRALKLAYKNLSIVSAYMVIVDHVKKNLKCLDETRSLLGSNATTTHEFILCRTFPEHKGAYLH